MTTDEFRAAMANLNLTQGGLARLFTALGDPAAPLTIRRRVERWAQGGSAIPGEVAAFLQVLMEFPVVLRTLRPRIQSRREKAMALAIPAPRGLVLRPGQRRA